MNPVTGHPSPSEPRQTLQVRITTPDGEQKDLIAFEAALSADGITLQVIPAGAHDYLSFQSAVLAVRGRDAAEARFKLGEGFASLWDGALSVMVASFEDVSSAAGV